MHTHLTSYSVYYERLVALKNQYDATNLFHLNQNIKPKVEENGQEKFPAPLLAIK